MPNATYIFGGMGWEWLPNGESTWIDGGMIPNYDFEEGCGVAISDEELVLIGGKRSKHVIQKFNVKDHSWQEIDGPLIQEKYGHSCIKLNNTIIVSGGRKSYSGYINSTELIDVETLSARPGPEMNVVRAFHRLVLAHINDELKVLAVGGYSNHGYTDTIELWDPESESWTLSSDMTLAEAKYELGAVSVPTRLVCP